MSFVLTWTAEMDDQLRRLWAEGKTTYQIAQLMAKHGVPSRYSISGRAHRIGLSRPSPIRRRVSGEDLQPQRKRDRERAAQAVIAPAPAPAPAPKPVLPPIKHLTRLAAMDGRCACAWPIGDPKSPSFRFCAAPVVKPGASYCAEHCERAYRDAPDYRRGITP